MFTQPFVQAQIKENMKLRITGLCEGDSPVTGEFPAQRSSNVENVSIWWRHNVKAITDSSAYVMVLQSMQSFNKANLRDLKAATGL